MMVLPLAGPAPAVLETRFEELREVTSARFHRDVPRRRRDARRRDAGNVHGDDDMTRGGENSDGNSRPDDSAGRPDKRQTAQRRYIEPLLAGHRIKWRPLTKKRRAKRFPGTAWQPSPYFYSDIDE